MDDFRKEQQIRVGVGGMKCYCCNDYIGKEKSKLNRLARHAVKRKTKQIIEECE